MTIHSSGSVWKPFVRSAAVEVDTAFPRPDWTSTYPGHGEIYPATSEKFNVGQYAVDFMIGSKAEGDKIAAYLLANMERLGIRYIIWYRRIISRTNLPMQWRTYVNPNPAIRGTASGDHTNHVHASFFSNGKYVPLGGGSQPVPAPAPAPSSPVIEGSTDYPTPTGCTIYTEVVTPGTKDSDSVWWVQRWLNSVPLPSVPLLKLTGAYDVPTVAAARAFQSSLGDDVDGALGPKQLLALWGQASATNADLPKPTFVNPTLAPTPAPEPTPTPTPEPIVTTIRVATLNCLHDVAATPFGPRRDKIVQVLKDSGASVLLLQEINAASCAAIQDKLGADWIWSRAGANAVMVNKTVWTLDNADGQYHLPTPYTTGSTKTCPLVNLTHKNGPVIWATSVHPSATLDGDATKLAEERKQQAEYIVSTLKPYSLVVGGGDFNSSSFSVGKPKQILQSSGFKLLTQDPDFESKNVDSFPNKTPGGQQIDEVFVRGLEITDGKIIDAGSGSDHNLMWAELTVKS